MTEEEEPKEVRSFWECFAYLKKNEIGYILLGASLIGFAMMPLWSYLIWGFRGLWLGIPATFLAINVFIAALYKLEVINYRESYNKSTFKFVCVMSFIIPIFLNVMAIATTIDLANKL